MAAVHGQQHYARWVRQRCRRQPAAPGRLDRQDARHPTAECTVSPDRYPKGIARKTVREERIDGRGEGWTAPRSRTRGRERPSACGIPRRQPFSQRKSARGKRMQASPTRGHQVRWPERAARRPHREQGEQSEAPPARRQMGTLCMRKRTN